MPRTWLRASTCECSLSPALTRSTRRPDRADTAGAPDRPDRHVSALLATPTTRDRRDRHTVATPGNSHHQLSQALRTVYGSDVRGTLDLNSPEVPRRSLFDRNAAHRFPAQAGSAPWPPITPAPTDRAIGRQPTATTPKQGNRRPGIQHPRHGLRGSRHPFRGHRGREVLPLRSTTS